MAEDSNEQDLLSCEEKRMAEIAVEINSLLPLENYLNIEYERLTSYRGEVKDIIANLRDELDALKQGQLILKGNA